MKITSMIIALTLLAIQTLNNNAVADTHEEKNKANYAETEVLQTDAGKVVIQFHQAIQKGNKKKARSFLDDNVIIYEGGRVERSADTYAEHHMFADMKYLADLNVEVLEHQVTVLGSTAYSMSRTKLTGQYEGKDINSEGMESMVLQKEAGKWKIVHIHWSH